MATPLFEPTMLARTGARTISSICIIEWCAHRHLQHGQLQVSQGSTFKPVGKLEVKRAYEIYCNGATILRFTKTFQDWICLIS